MLSSADWDRVGQGPPINHCRRLDCLLRRRALLIAACYDHDPMIDRTLRFIDRTKTAIIEANRDNPNPPF